MRKKIKIRWTETRSGMMGVRIIEFYLPDYYHMMFIVRGNKRINKERLFKSLPLPQVIFHKGETYKARGEVVTGKGSFIIGQEELERKIGT